MSVAFRRESDEEHKEPKFEIPIPAGPNLVSERGLEQIAARISELTAAIAAGGSEAEIEATKRDLRYWSTRQTMARLAPKPDGDEVAFGTRVGFKLNGDTRTVTIVGDDEADPAAGSISFSAPLARAMLGAIVGDVLDFGGWPEALEILSIDVK